MIVFDSSALVAYVRDERGAEFVADLIEDGDVPMFAHAANLCEAFHLLTRSDGREFAEEAVRDFLRLGVVERADMDGAFWRDAANLIAARRMAGASLPLGDALGVALARRLGADFVTGDRGELLAIQAAGVASITFFR
jgi:predicted nucleic acid-binding protein